MAHMGSWPTIIGVIYVGRRPERQAEDRYKLNNRVSHRDLKCQAHQRIITDLSKLEGTSDNLVKTPFSSRITLSRLPSLIPLNFISKDGDLTMFLYSLLHCKSSHHLLYSSRFSHILIAYIL